MGHFLDVAERVLRTVGRPLTAIEITERGRIRAWLSTRGQTPSQTMKAKLSTDILRYKDESRFMRTAPAQFGLRGWLDLQDLTEYIAPRFRRAILDEEIAVFDRGILRDFVSGTGFFMGPLSGGKDLAIRCRPMIRRQAEEDETVIQLVSVFVVRSPQDRYLTYKRTGHLPEQRLRGAYSMLFGGHIRFDELKTLFNPFSTEMPLGLAPVRELEEELRLGKQTPAVVYTGFLYDERFEVSRQHLGIVYSVRLAETAFAIGEKGFLVDPKQETISEIGERLEEFENWSRLLYESLAISNEITRVE